MVKQTCHGWLYNCPGTLSSLAVGRYIDICQVAFHTLPPFAPYIPTFALPYLAVGLLSSTFGLAFYFTTYVTLQVLLHPLTRPTLACLPNLWEGENLLFPPLQVSSEASESSLCFAVLASTSDQLPYINYLHAIRVCKLHTSCQSVSIVPTILKTYCVEDRGSFIRASQLKTLRSCPWILSFDAPAFLLSMLPCVHMMDIFQKPRLL